METLFTLSTPSARNKHCKNTAVRVTGRASRNVFFSKSLFLLFLLGFLLFPGIRSAHAQKGEKDLKEALPFVFETFENVPFQELPEGWSGTFEVYHSDGFNSTNRLTSFRMFLPGQTRTWTTPEIALPQNPTFSFMYRVVNNTSYPDNPTPATSFTLVFSVSIDGGITWNPIHTINSENHTASSLYASKNIDISAYAEQTVQIRAVATHITGDFWVDFDDVITGEFSQVFFTVENNENVPVEGASIQVSGDVNTSLTTDSNGEVSAPLPAGDYSYSLSAAHYQTPPSGNFTIGEDDVFVNPVSLIGQFPVTFSVEDQLGNPIGSAEVAFTGVAETYDGPENVSGTFITLANGTANVPFKYGTYEYAATKENFYPTEGNFVHGNATLATAVVLQSFPAVTFTITNQNGDPLPDAVIAMEGYDNLVTDAAGQATRLLPDGNYSYAASLIGYTTNDASFSVAGVDDIVLPPLVLQEADPTFAFVTDVEEGIQFETTLVNFTDGPFELTFTNTGSGTVTIDPDDIILTGSAAADFLLNEITDPIVLSTGQQESVFITFSPLSDGIKNATLEITDDSGITHAVNLSGESYLPVTLPFLENFETGAFNNWFVVNGTQNNQWHVGTADGEEDGFSAIISNDNGATNFYQIEGIGARSRVHFYMDFDIPAAGADELFLQFTWKGEGEPFLDLMRVYIIDPEVKPVAGEMLAGQIGSFNQQSEWTLDSLPIPENQTGEIRRIVFSWINNSEEGTQPPAAIDNIYIGALYTLTTATDPADAGTITGAGDYGDGIPVNVSATPNEGYIFSHWSATAGTFADANSAETVFTMPGEDAEITAHFTFPGPEVTDVTETYDGTEHSLAAGVPDGVEVTWYNAETGGEVIAAPTSVDVATITAWATTTENGAESQRTQATLTVLPRPLTVTADEDQSKIYGEGDPALTFDVTEGNLIGDDELTGALEREAGEDAGTYEILQGTLTASSNYEITFTPEVLFTITPKPLTVINAVVQDKTYDGTDEAVIAGADLDGVVTGDEGDVALANAETGTFAQSDTGTDIEVTTSMTLTGDKADNYTLTQPETLQADITPAALEIIANDITKVGGVEYTFAGDEFTTLPETLFADDAITSVELASDGAAAGADAGTYPITVSNAQGPGLTNYAISYTSGTMTVAGEQIALTLPDLTVEDKAYDGTTDAVIADFGTLTGIDPDFPDVELVTTGVIATFASPDAAENITVTVTGFALTGADADVYFIEDIATTATITQRPITVTADDASKMYGNDDPAFTFTITEGSLVSDDTVTGELTREPGEDAGTYAIQQGTLEVSDNYLMNFIPGTFEISPRLITISVDPQTKVYGEADPEFTFMLLDGDLVPGDELTGELSREPGEDVGTYEILIGTLDAGDNYLLSYEGAQLTITVLPIAVAADDQTKIYGEADPALTYQITDGELAFDDEFTGELSRTEGEDIGTYTIEQGTLALSANYDLSFTEADFTITPMDLTVTADDLTKTYGDDDPELTWQVTAGELAFDDELTGELSREAGEDIGDYTIQQGTLAASDNYILTFVEGQLTISPRELTIGGSFTAADKEYDGTTEAVIISDDLTLEGVVGTDVVELIDVVAEFVSPEPGQGIEVVIASAAISGADAANYTLTLEGAPTTTASIIEPSYVLTIVTEPVEGGTASGEGSYQEGETASLNATPATDYIFLRWENADGDELSTDAAFDFVMPAEDVTLTAVFDLDNSVQGIATMEMKLFPNPAGEFVNITSDIQMEHVVITDLSGKEMHTENVGHTTARINTGHLPTGIYLVRIHTDKGVQVLKLQVQ